MSINQPFPELCLLLENKSCVVYLKDSPGKDQENLQCEESN